MMERWTTARGARTALTGFNVLAVLAVLGVGLVLAGPVSAYEDPCADTDECRTHGHCFSLPFDACGTGEDSCRYSYSCLHEGRCTFESRERGCIATLDQDCRNASDCSDYGRCFADPETQTCIVGEGGCLNSGDCATEGRCTLRDGRCVVGSSEDCAASELCERRGRCTLVGRLCVATSVVHCIDSENCRLRGQCHLVNLAGEAVESLERGGACEHAGQCAESEACYNHGACAPGERGACVPASAEHCSRSAACARQGRCTFVPPPSPPPQPTSEDGLMMAMISADLTVVRGPACIVGGPEDCEQVCEGQPHCQYVEGFMSSGACQVLDSGIMNLLGGDHFMDSGTFGLGGPGTGRGEGEQGEGMGGGGTMSIGVIGGFGRLGGTAPPEEDEDEDAGENDAGNED